MRFGQGAAGEAHAVGATYGRGCSVPVITNHHVRGVLPSLLAGLAAAAVAAALLVFNPAGARAAPAPVDLGTAANFSVLAGSTVTNTGATFMSQSLGVHPGNTAEGFPPGLVGGAIHLADAVALQAKSDLTTAYNDAAGRTPFTILPAELGGNTVIPGVYRISAAQLTGQLTLDAQGDPQAVFIFQIDSTLITASNSSVILVNGASPCNVYWKVGSSATLGTGTIFVGNILAQASITMNTGATLQGRALAQTAAVTLDTNTITSSVCVTPTPTASPTDSPTASPTASPTVSPTASPTVSPTASPTVSPTASPTVSPTASPTASPTVSPTASPTASPTVSPTASPTASPTVSPTASPTASPTVSPTASPTASPTVSPTASPTVSPTASPTVSPTASPTASPTVSPTASPTVSPTASPTASPTVSPTASPTASPTVSPTASPTVSPTASPTASPTVSPTASPTASPTVSPTVKPTASPTVSPTVKPTASPTVSPTASPTVIPTVAPTDTPPGGPTVRPPGGPDRPGGLPTTGSGLVPILMGTGIGLIVLGAIILILYRRRLRES
ncbi:ice-binding family protein [Micromonospora sp. CPCC 205371]|nr:ice-binding family protein [Micromonospora sp. CPCC 205371]